MGLFIISCSKEEIEPIPYIPPVYTKLPNLINRDDYSRKHFTVSNEIFYENNFIATISDLNGPYNEDKDWEPMPDIASFDYDGNSTKMGFYKDLLEGKNQYDSINGLLYDVSDINKDGKNDYLLNFWGEGLYGSWYFPNYLVSAVSNGNSYDYTIVEDLTQAEHRGVYYSQTYFDFDGDGHVDIKAGSMSNHYFKNNGDNTFTKIINDDLFIGPGEYIKMDYDGDGDLDLLVFQKSNNHIDVQTTSPQITIFEGGTNISKKIIKIDWDFDSTADLGDFKIVDINNDGLDDLIFITTDTQNIFIDGQVARNGFFKILINNITSFSDRSAEYVDINSFQVLNGQSFKIFVDDYDNDGDSDIFFPFYITRGNNTFYNFYYKNENGRFIKKNR